jgi:DNA-damage-inducible protein J
MTTSDAMRLFLKQVALRGTFPLELKTPNRETINAFEEKNLKSVSLEELRDI